VLNEVTKVGGLQVNFDIIDIRRQAGDWFKVEASQAGEGLTHIWEVSGTNLSRSKALSPILQSQLCGVNTENSSKLIQKIKLAVRDLESEKFTADEAERNVDMWSAIYGAPQETARSLFIDIANNGEFFLDVSYTFRHTFVCPERTFIANTGEFAIWNARLFANVNRVHTETQLRQWEGPTSGTYLGAWFLLPRKLSDVSLTAEWIKQAPHESFTRGQKRETVVEYLHCDYASRLYYANAT
jgi:hypothetical protein